MTKTTWVVAFEVFMIAMNVLCLVGAILFTVSGIFALPTDHGMLQILVGYALLNTGSKKT